MNLVRTVLPATVMLSLTLTGTANVSSLSQEVVDPNRVIIRLQPERTEAELGTINVVARIPQIEMLVISTDDPDAKIRELSQHPAVLYAERDRRVQQHVVPNDPRYPEQWALPKINAPQAWDVTKGLSNVVAVLDGGIDYSHPDLDAKVLYQNDFVEVDSTANPQNNIWPGVSGCTSDGYTSFSGTSSAAPHAAGAAALVLSLRPNLWPDAVEWTLRKTAVDLGAAGRDDIFGYGRINAQAAVNEAKNSPVLPFGDVQCDGDTDIVDKQAIDRYIASLSYTQTEPCADINVMITVTEFSTGLVKSVRQGDVDCNGVVDSVDSLKVQRYVAGLSYSQTEPCPDIGSIVDVN